MGGILKYLSFQGRANRKRFWLTTLSLFGLFLVSSLIVMGVTAASPFLSLIVVPFWLAFLVASVANGARRLHDRNKSAWWLLLFSGLPTLLAIPYELAKYGPPDDFQLAAAALAALGLPFSIWGFIVVGCLKGTTGPNRFGDDPLSQPLEETFA